MREILFRAKSREDGEWVYGGYFTAKGYLSGETMHFIAAKECEAFPRGEITDATEIAPETLGQYTGLTDKNGKKIFEGDVIRYPDDIQYNEYKEHYNEGIVEWSDDEMLFFFTNRWVVEMEDFEVDNGKMIEVEIIGNIHDNPELVGNNDMLEDVEE